MQNEPRWLTPEEQATWIAFIRVAVKLPAMIDAQLQRDANLSHFDYYVLVALSDATGHTLRMSTLAARAEVSLSHLSRVVARLERRGLVTRRSDPDDGRSTLAWLTDAGLAELSAAAPGHVSAVREALFDALTEHQAHQLGAVCTLLQRHLWPASASASSETPD